MSVEEDQVVYERPLAVHKTGIEGLLLVDLPVHGDRRGWFKENWQRTKLRALGFPEFRPVQNNVSFNASRGTTRGLHAEPWDKFVSVGCGRIFGAWVDLRPGKGFGRRFTVEIGPDRAIFVPRGVANGFQTLTDDTVYTYLVDAHWSVERTGDYSFVNLADPALAIDWPIPLGDSIRSDKDLTHPMLADARPVRPRPVLVLGADGQVGRALRVAFGPLAEYADRRALDITAAGLENAYDWGRYGAVIDAAAFTAVDEAETSMGRQTAWAVNAAAPARLAALAAEHDFTLVTYSSDYVFDGTREVHDEDEPFAPLGVYGQTKAAGDIAVVAAPRHLVLRTSWVLGAGQNFVATMWRLARKGIHPSVVDDQTGRPTYASTLAEATIHLLGVGAPSGVYNVTQAGEPRTWADLAADVFELADRPRDWIRPVTTREYVAAAGRALAPRPGFSTLELAKVRAVGFSPREYKPDELLAEAGVDPADETDLNRL